MKEILRERRGKREVEEIKEEKGKVMGKRKEEKMEMKGKEEERGMKRKKEERTGKERGKEVEWEIKRKWKRK